MKTRQFTILDECSLFEKQRSRHTDVSDIWLTKTWNCLMQPTENHVNQMYYVPPRLPYRFWVGPHEWPLLRTAVGTANENKTYSLTANRGLCLSDFLLRMRGRLRRDTRVEEVQWQYCSVCSLSPHTEPAKLYLIYIFHHVVAVRPEQGAAGGASRPPGSASTTSAASRRLQRRWR